MDPANEGTIDDTECDATNAGGGSDADSKDPRRVTDLQQSPGLPYDVLLDVCEEMVDLASVMEQMELGPNGGLVYCMEYMEARAEELVGKIQDKVSDKTYLLFDFPGQVELYTHSTCVQNLLRKLIHGLNLRLTAVQLIDAQYCTDATKFLSAALLATTTMIRLELPAVNVLSKVDLLSKYGELHMDFEFFADCHDLDRLVPFIESNHPLGVDGRDDHDNEFDYVEDLDYQRARKKRLDSMFSKKYASLHRALAEVIEDFGLLAFLPLDITNAASVGRVLARIDKCNGYIFTESSVNEDLFQCAIASDNTKFEAISEVRERVSGLERFGELD